MLPLGGFRLPLARSALRLNLKRSARFDTGMMGFVEGLSLKRFHLVLKTMKMSGICARLSRGNGDATLRCPFVRLRTVMFVNERAVS